MRRSNGAPRWRSPNGSRRLRSQPYLSRIVDDFVYAASLARHREPPRFLALKPGSFSDSQQPSLRTTSMAIADDLPAAVDPARDNLRAPPEQRNESRRASAEYRRPR